MENISIGSADEPIHWEVLFILLQHPNHTLIM